MFRILGSLAVVVVLVVGFVLGNGGFPDLSSSPSQSQSAPSAPASDLTNLRAN